MKNRILLVGGAGFIGSYITKNLISFEDEIFVLDSFIQYSDPVDSNYGDEIKVRFGDASSRVNFVRGDVRNCFHLQQKINDICPTHIIYLAAMPIANLANDNSEEAFGCNVTGLFNCLEVVKSTNLKRFIYVSSSMIYGDFESIPCSENHSTKPKGLYGGFKLAGENMIQAYARRYNMDFCIVRPSAVYGPTDTNRRVSQIFVENALNNKEIILHNNGSIKLDFTYVEDTADGIVRALMSERASGETFNITYGEGRSLLEFAEILKEVVGDIKVNIVDGGDDNRPRRGSLCIEKAKDLLGYCPKTNLESGIEKYVNYCRSKHEDKCCIFNG